MKRRNNRKSTVTQIRNVLRSVLFMLAIAVHPVQAIGVGSASADSFIGERLSAVIPLFNVEQPDGLQIDLLSSSVDHAKGVQLLIELDKTNSQLALRVHTDVPVNEPYISFNLALTDQGNTVNKEFTLLLNLAPDDRSEQSSSAPLAVTSPRVTNLNNAANGELKEVASGDLMGPYQWAEQGNIPDRFGPVIDGQSLWRVARRINKAMDVSINQLMLALYQQNPQAFMTRSVDSLSAGSYLSIPDVADVRQFSDTRAREMLAELASTGDLQTNDEGTNASDTTAVQNPVPAEGSLLAEGSLSAEGSSLAEGSSSAEGVSSATEPVLDESFRLSGISADQLSGMSAAGVGQDLKSQEIISSLAATVGNLTQELIQRDKKIEFLQDKIATLEKLAGVNASSLGAVVSASSFESQDAPETAALVADTPETKPASRLWIWLLGLIAILLAVFYLFRERVIELLGELNLFGGERAVDFGSPATEASAHQAASHGEGKEYSILSAVKDTMKSEDEGVAFIDLMDAETEIHLDHAPEGIEINESSLDFEHRFERLISEHDFDFALELLEFARHNEIDEDRYHYERLRLFQAMGDEEGFYDYYYKIEPQISTFDVDSQNRISQLVVKLAQTKS